MPFRLVALITDDQRLLLSRLWPAHNRSSTVVVVMAKQIHSPIVTYYLVTDLYSTE